jgi:nicotinic acetylcholine receptor
MSRKTLYYTVNLIVPTGLMSILICIVFCLPTAAGEKMTLCMSILLALNLFQLLVTKILPPTSAVVPLIAKYLLFTFTLNVLVIGKNKKLKKFLKFFFLFFLLLKVNTVIITNFYFRTPMTHTMPNWLRQLFLHILPRLLWMESPKLRDKWQEYELSSTINDTSQSVILQNPLHTLNETNNNRQKIKSKQIDKVISSF